jgi:hypothetical protein
LLLTNVLLSRIDAAQHVNVLSSVYATKQ